MYMYLFTPWQLLFFKSLGNNIKSRSMVIKSVSFTNKPVDKEMLPNPSGHEPTVNMYSGHTLPQMSFMALPVDKTGFPRSVIIQSRLKLSLFRKFLSWIHKCSYPVFSRLYKLCMSPATDDVESRPIRLPTNNTAHCSHWKHSRRPCIVYMFLKYFQAQRIAIF